MTLPRFDPAPVLTHLRLRGLTPEFLADAGGDTPQRLLAAPLAWYVADRYAVALGLHPVLLWGDEWWDVAKAADDQLREKRLRYRTRRQGEEAAA